MTDTYAIHTPGQHDAVGHATNLTGAVAALAALLERPLEDLHTEQPGAFGGWLVRDADGATVGAIVLEGAFRKILPGGLGRARLPVSDAESLERDRVQRARCAESGVWSPSRSYAIGDRVMTPDGVAVCTHSGAAPSSTP